LSATEDKNDFQSNDELLACSQKLGAMVDALHCESLLEIFFKNLSEICPFEMGALFIYRNRSKPLCLYDTFKNQKARLGLKNYVEYTYVLNPFYQTYLSGITPGVFRIQDLAPDAYFTSEHHNLRKISVSNTEDIGYITEGWPKGREEISIAIQLDKGAAAEVSLLRPNQGGFRHQDLEKLRWIEPIIASLIRSYWHERESRKNQITDSSIDEAFENFGKPILTDRECKVVQLILRGHSTLSISLHLNVAVTTIKSHRKNAYMKLEISTQSELLSLFIDSLKTIDSQT